MMQILNSSNPHFLKFLGLSHDCQGASDAAENLESAIELFGCMSSRIARTKETPIWSARRGKDDVHVNAFHEKSAPHLDGSFRGADFNRHNRRLGLSDGEAES